MNEWMDRCIDVIVYTFMCGYMLVGWEVIVCISEIIMNPTGWKLILHNTTLCVQ